MVERTGARVDKVLCHVRAPPHSLGRLNPGITDGSKFRRPADHNKTSFGSAAAIDRGDQAGVDDVVVFRMAFDAGPNEWAQRHDRGARGALGIERVTYERRSAAREWSSAPTPGARRGSTLSAMTRRSHSLLLAVASVAPLAVCGAGAFAASAPDGVLTVASTVPPIDDPANPDALNEAGEKSSQAPHRFEMFMDMSGLGLSIDSETPLATGEYANGASHMVIDFGAIFESVADDMPTEMQGMDMTMEMISEGTDLYIRAPFFAAMAEDAGGAAGPLGAFATSGDGWGYVDGSQIPGVTAGQISGTFGIGGADPSAFFDLLTDVEGAEAIGTEEIRGVGSVGVRAEVSVAELMAAQGTDTSQLPVSGVDFASMTMPIEVWIDNDGFVRRIVMDISPETFADAAESSGQDLDPDMLGGFEMSMTMEMFDYAATDIVIEVPIEFVDITDDFIELVEQQGG